MEKITLGTQLLQYLITGLTVGSVYAMVAIGFNIIYNVTEIINLAQGEFVMLGGLTMVFFHVGLGLSIFLAFPLIFDNRHHFRVDLLQVFYSHFLHIHFNR